MLFDSGSLRPFLNENAKKKLNLKTVRKQNIFINIFSE